MNLSTYVDVLGHPYACTALKKGKPCARPATRRRALNHPAPVCATCYKRLYRQGTVECSAAGCTVRLLPRGRKGRTVPDPWCRRHEHLALALEVLGANGREAVKAAVVRNVVADWETGCWVWTGRKVNGYSRWKSKATGEWVGHRLTWHLFHEGHGLTEELDHRHAGNYGGGALCVSPLHLQPVTQARNLELRDLRRTAPLGYWYREGEEGSVPLPLMVFAMLNALPLKTPELDYSAQWAPTSMDEALPALPEPEPVREYPGEPEEAVPFEWSSIDTSGLPISARIIRELKLCPLEVAYLRAWFHKPAFVQREVTRAFKENPVTVTALYGSGPRRNRRQKGSGRKRA